MNDGRGVVFRRYDFDKHAVDKVPARDQRMKPLATVLDASLQHLQEEVTNVKTCLTHRLHYLPLLSLEPAKGTSGMTTTTEVEMTPNYDKAAAYTRCPGCIVWYVHSKSASSFIKQRVNLFLYSLVRRGNEQSKNGCLQQVFLSLNIKRGNHGPTTGVCSAFRGPL